MVRLLPPRVATVDSRRVAALPPAPKQTDPHYLTPAHREWRRQVLQRDGYQCRDPEHDPARPRSGVRLFADHIVELKDGGAALDVSNGLARCASCHAAKTHREKRRRQAIP
ncbi:MAG: HNH endonuclease [Bauldia sp.]|nr:HNH endonuclease [Bauldia sp.]